MRTWVFDGKVNIDFEKADVMCVTAMLEPVQIQLKKAVTAMDYPLATSLIKTAEEIKKAVAALQEGEKDESCDSDGTAD